MKLYVGNLPFKATEDGLRAHFSVCGPVTEVAIVLDKETRRSRGFGFVTMETEEGGRAAIEKLNGQPLDGRDLIVNEARPREERAPRR